MEIRISYEGDQVLLHVAIPGFDAAKWSSSDKYLFRLPEAQANRLASLLLTLCENKGRRVRAYLVGDGYVEEERVFKVHPSQCPSTHGSSGWPEGSFISDGKMTCALCGAQS